MSTFSIGTTSFSWYNAALGQMFTPSVPGPNGSGSPGTASTVTLTSITVGYPNSPYPRSSVCYVLSAPAQDPADPAGDPNLVGTSSGSCQDGNAFGTGSYTRTFNFGDGVPLSVGQAYYVYFPAFNLMRCSQPSNYAGDSFIDMDGSLVDASAQFKADFST